MALTLDPTERRILGCLIEKQATTPEAYPLTLNSLVLACNQKSNREPETEWNEHFVMGALRALMDRGWVEELERIGSRVKRYAHLAIDQLGADAHDLALLAELMLRGPQSSKELETRASRMKPFASLDEVERRLTAMGSRPVPYVRLLGRRPGERVPRWEQLLGGGEAITPTAPTPRVAATRLEPVESRGSVDPLADILDRLTHLEREVESLREEMASQHRAPGTE